MKKEKITQTLKGIIVEQFGLSENHVRTDIPLSQLCPELIHLANLLKIQTGIADTLGVKIALAAHIQTSYHTLADLIDLVTQRYCQEQK